MWIWSRMERVSWMDKITNEDILNKVFFEKRQLISVIRNRQKNWIGRVEGRWIIERSYGRKDGGKETKSSKRCGLHVVGTSARLPPLPRCKSQQPQFRQKLLLHSRGRLARVSFKECPKTAFGLPVMGVFHESCEFRACGRMPWRVPEAARGPWLASGAGDG